MTILSYEIKGDMIVVHTDYKEMPTCVYFKDKFKNKAELEKELEKKFHMKIKNKTKKDNNLKNLETELKKCHKLT